VVNHKVFGCTLLTAGTSIGAGMLALPITTGLTGTIPALVVFIASFIFMLMNLFIFLEASFYCAHHEANVISIIKARLGRTGSTIAGITYLLLFYAVLAAYISGGGELLADASQSIHFILPGKYSYQILFTLIFGIVIYSQARGVDQFNRLLMMGLMLSFLILVILISKNAQFDFIKRGETQYVWAAIPVVVVAFTCHLILPTIKNYLNDHIPSIKQALFWGSLIPLIFYIIWEFLLVSALPITGGFSLTMIANSPDPIVALAHTLSNNLNITSALILMLFFSFFALLTSFLAVGLSLMDFFADLFQLAKTPRTRLLLVALTLVPPLLFAVFNPTAFVHALGFAGVFVVILFSILPICAIWKARYHEKLSAPYQCMLGQPALVIWLLFALFIIILHSANMLGMLPGSR